MSLTSNLFENQSIQELTTIEIAQVLAARLAIASNDWHKFKNNRQAQAAQQASAGLVLLLKGQKESAIANLSQAVGWLDKSVNPLPCESHKSKKI